MSHAFSIIAGVLVILVCESSASDPSWVGAVYDLIHRLTPAAASNFFLRGRNSSTYSEPQFPGMVNDFFSVTAFNGTVTIEANSGVALASGYYHYLKHTTNCQVTWGEDGSGNQLNLPPALPDYAATVINATVPFRYAWNMCTLSYSAAFWSEERWMREIDWLALHGINFPLAFTGQEYVWLQVFADYNVSLEQLEDWFSGPAFLAWQRAGNIQGFGGPLPAPFITSQMQLQLKILERMRLFGMKPILPCFAGHVPQISTTIWPTANFTKSTAWDSPLPFWSNQTRVLYLDPTDALFLELGRKFLQKQQLVYGSDHYYNCDTFNEADPTSTDLVYLANASRAVHEAIALEDPEGIWVMQAWLFHFEYWSKPERVQAYLSGVPNASMIILDLNSENGTLAPQFNQYYGKSWVWNLLHNYGGVRGMYGNLSEIASGPFASLAEEGSTMMGIGFTPEAIEQNPVVYELLTDTFWSKRIDLNSWMDMYVRQRYGVPSAGLRSSWQSLVRAVYGQPAEPRSDIEWVPNWLNCTDSCSLWGNTNLYGWQFGDPDAMLEAFRLFQSAAASIPLAEQNGPLMYDLVDIGRQAATMFFTDVHRMLTNVGVLGFPQHTPPRSKATASFADLSQLMKRIILSIDDLLATNPNYLLGKWIQDALDLANSSSTSLFMYNAKNQVTLWGPTGQINDYAAKGWAGLYGTYYYGRWALLLDMMESQQDKNLPWDQPSFASAVLNFEMAWDSSSSSFSSTPSGLSAINASATILNLVTAAGSNASFAPGYFSLPAGNAIVDANAASVPQMWSRDVGQLSILCNIVANCVGFTSDGVVHLVESIPLAGAITVGSASAAATTFVKLAYVRNVTYGSPSQPEGGAHDAAIIGGVAGAGAIAAVVAALVVSRHQRRQLVATGDYQRLDGRGAAGGTELDQEGVAVRESART